MNHVNPAIVRDTEKELATYRELCKEQREKIHKLELRVWELETQVACFKAQEDYVKEK